MTTSAASTTAASTTVARIRERVKQIETLPAIPAVFLPLLNVLNLPIDQVKLEEVVKLVSYDNTIAAQCLRMASSPLFGLGRAPESIKAAVISLGLRRVETILLTCCMGNVFSLKNSEIDPTNYWRHSLGCAMVCRKLSEKLSARDGDKAYVAGLLHDMGFLANCMVFAKEFALAMEYAFAQQVPLEEAELATMGFTHCDSGFALAENWNLTDDMRQTIAHHHHPERSNSAQPLVALVHLSDLLCRTRNLGYGYYERQKVDLVHNPAWTILAKEYECLAGIDLARFSFELDDTVDEIGALVNIIFRKSGSG